eukprot:7227111-Ditylum_brightwellii.AAC.1
MKLNNSNNNVKETKGEEKRSKTDTKTGYTILALKKINSFVDAHKTYLEASKDKEEEAVQEEEL